MTHVDLESVLARLGISFRRRGRELTALCPFHEERTPSWSIRSDGSEKHGLWRCWGACEPPGDRGEVVGLVARVLGLTTEDGSQDRAAARRWIGLDEDRAPDPPPLAVEVEVDGPRAAFALPRGATIAPSDAWPTLPRRYLLEERAVSAEQIDRWGLGYASIGKLAGRVVFPARDAFGVLRSYSARTFVGDRLKWRSADRADRPDPDALFGEAFWPASGARGSVVLVEAALDSLAVERATDRRRSVAAMHGSEFTSGHAGKLATFAEVLVATDPDEAGEKIHEAARAALARWTRVRRIRLPPGLDASKLWRTDPDELRRILSA